MKGCNKKTLERERESKRERKSDLEKEIETQHLYWCSTIQIKD